MRDSRLAATPTAEGCSVSEPECAPHLVRKRVGKLVAGLKGRVRDNDLEGLWSALMQAPRSAHMLRALREQKIVLQGSVDHRPEAAEYLVRYARAEHPSDAETFERTQNAVIQLEERRQAAEVAFASKLQNLPRLNSHDLANLSEDLFHRGIKSLAKFHTLGAPSSVAHGEANLHDLNGSANDLAFAVLRLINEISRRRQDSSARNLTRTQHAELMRRLFKLVGEASEINSFEWVIDSICFGDFSVSHRPIATSADIQLEYADPLLQKLRTSAIRRYFIARHLSNRPKRFLHGRLEGCCRAFGENALEYYARSAGVVPNTVGDAEFIDSQRVLLNCLDAEDDLLFAAALGSTNIQLGYISQLALQSYNAALESVRRGLPASRRSALRGASIPLDDIALSVKDGQSGEAAYEALLHGVSHLPARSHFDLIRRPFMFCDQRSVRSLIASNGSWNASLRERFLQGGAFGQAYGKLWEDLIAKGFESDEWSVLARGVKLRTPAGPLTDVDLLLLRGDLLLVAQVKALIGSGANTYDHWRNRQTIEWGCEQANISAEYLRSNRRFLENLGPRKITTLIRRIEPIVLTSLSHFDGWKYQGVRVLAGGSRSLLTEGLTVEYRRGRDPDILHSHTYFKAADLANNDLLKELDNPLELRVGIDDVDPSHAVHRLADLTIHLPVFRQRPGRPEAEIGMPKQYA